MKTPISAQKIFISLYFLGLTIYSCFDLVGGYQTALFSISTIEKILLFGIVIAFSFVSTLIVQILLSRVSVREQLPHWDGLMLGMVSGFIFDQISYLQFLAWPNIAYSFIASTLFVIVFIRAVFSISTPRGRMFLVFVVFAGLIAKLDNQRISPHNKKDERPNLVFVTIDGLNATVFQDADIQKLRSFYFLEHNGISFEQMYSASSDPILSYQTLLTSRLPSYASQEIKNREIPPNIAQWFKFLEYKTAGFISSDILGSEFHKGFQYFDDEFSCMRGWGLWFGGRLLPCSTKNRSSAQTTSQMILWMEKQQRPFLSWINFSELQGEYSPPAEWSDHFYRGSPFEHHSEECLHQIAPIHLENAKGRCSKEWMLSQYKAEIASLDAPLMQIISWITAHPNTMLVVMGGYGQHLADRFPWFGREHITRESTHIPAFIWFPSILPREKKITSLVSAMDILPTVFDIFGISFDGHVDGTTLIPEIYHAEEKDYILGVEVGGNERFVLEAGANDWKKQELPR